MRTKIIVAAVAVLTGCGGNPFIDPATGGSGGTGSGSVAVLPGTTTPTASKSLVRYEPTKDANKNGTGNLGDGYAQNITFDPVSHSFTVDNLAFDGDNTYRLPAVQPAGGNLPYTVYESADVVQDPVTGAPINQFTHRLLAGVSKTGRTEFAIVRTGAYRGYGFGGFVMKRNGGVTLPTPPNSQAHYQGDYAGLRDFNGIGGLEYATGKMTLDIDFKDFNDGNAVKGEVYDRKIYDINGTDITRQVLDAMDAKYDKDDKVAPSMELPVLVFATGPGTIDANGELSGVLDSTVVNYNGDTPSVEGFEAGNYYAMVTGDGADEVVGIIVVTSENPAFQGTTTRETGGFILYRP